MIGDGPDRGRLERLALRLGLEALFPGFVARGDRVLRIFDVFVLPTTFEGCSNVLAEAMAKGRPIVATDIPSVAWMFKDGENALLFRKNDVRDLAGALLRLIDDDVLRRRVGEGAYRNYLERFDARIMVEKVQGIYEGFFGAKEA
jgi:glycosyltransferase involved in cell wall biosynthesis